MSEPGPAVIRDILVGAVAGLLSAAFYKAYGPGLMGMALPLAPFPLFVVGLTNRVRSNGIAFAAAGIAAVGFVALGGLPDAASFAAAIVVPVAAIAGFALRCRTAPDGTEIWFPAGRIVAGLAAAAWAILALGAVLLAGHEGGVAGALEGFAERAIAETGAATDLSSAARVVNVLPGVTGGVIVALYAASGYAALRLLKSFGAERRPMPELARLKLPVAFAVATVVAGILAAVGDGTLGLFGRNAVAVAAVAYLIAGLGFVHAFSRPLRMGPRLFYMVILGTMIVFPFVAGSLLMWLAMTLIAVGFIDQWVGLRRRYWGEMAEEA